MDVTVLGPIEVPVEPDAEEARRLMLEELAKTKYTPSDLERGRTWLDDLSDWLQGLMDSVSGENTAPLWVVVVVIVAIAVLVVAFLVFGVPRLRARSAVEDELFDRRDERDAAAMRRDAARAADAGDFAVAIAELYRAIARGLHERGIVHTLPGSTAHDVARRAGLALPEVAERFETAAGHFDAVRYLDDPGDAERYAALTDLDRTVARLRPVQARGAAAQGTEARAVEEVAAP